MIDVPKLIKGLSTSKTMAGGLSLFAMLAGNVRLQGNIWIFDQPIPLDDGNMVLAALGLALVAWGRAKATGPLVAPKPERAALADEPKGFPRA